jgi:putative tryptophan/tyrosine transport system substrate-binding protein
LEAFQQQLRELGYTEGRNLEILYRWADGHDDRLPALAAELVRLNPDVMVTSGTPGALAAMSASQAGDPDFVACGRTLESGESGAPSLL